DVVHRDLVAADAAVRVEVIRGDAGDGLDELTGRGRRPCERNDVVDVDRTRGDVGARLRRRRGSGRGRGGDAAAGTAAGGATAGGREKQEGSAQDGRDGR